MTQEAGRSPRSYAFRDAIARFIEDRRLAKLKGSDTEADEPASSKYDYDSWLADAARRVGQIQAVTHVLKATHPDARGSSLHAAPATLPNHAEIGTHVLGEAYADDIVGNAAALDVYKFLKLEVHGRQLLLWMQDEDADLLAALNPDATVAQSWAQAFKNLIRPAESLASHENAKQVYWCTGLTPADDASYHLLQPMFSSSLAHAVHADITDARFGENNTQARQARRDGKPYDGVYRDYRGLVERKLGGTKPQNISQLNSERRGVNYLMASLPPIWSKRKLKPPSSSDAVWSEFLRQDESKRQITALCKLLKSNPDPTMETRLARERIEQALGATLVAYSAALSSSFEPGWTRELQYDLPLFEKLWLDPERAELPVREDDPKHQEDDEAFNAAFAWNDWPDEVAHRFGNQVNAILRKQDLPVGDAEHEHWAKQALIDAQWPVPVQRRALKPALRGEHHG